VQCKPGLQQEQGKKGVGYCYWYERVIRDYYGQFYISKMYNLIAMNKFLEAQALPRWNHEEIWNLNGPISWNKFELVTKSIQRKDSPAQNNSLLRSTTHFFRSNMNFSKLTHKKNRSKELFKSYPMRPALPDIMQKNTQGPYGKKKTIVQ
jgi:hypothetical protein